MGRATRVGKVLVLSGLPQGRRGSRARQRPRSLLGETLAAPHGGPVSTTAAGGQMRPGRRQRAAAGSGVDGVATVVRLRGEGGAWDCVAAEPQRRRSSSVASDTGLLTPCGHRDPPPATWRFSVPLSPGRLPSVLSRAGTEKILDGEHEARSGGQGEARSSSPGLLRRLALRMKEMCLK